MGAGLSPFCIVEPPDGGTAGMRERGKAETPHSRTAKSSSRFQVPGSRSERAGLPTTNAKLQRAGRLANFAARCLRGQFLFSLVVLPFIVVFEDGRLLKVRAFDHTDQKYILRMEAGGRIEVPDTRVEAIVDEAPSRESLPPLTAALTLSPFRDYSGLVVPYGRDLARTAREFDLNPLLLYCIMQVESAGNPRALSPKGAMGLMQLMPGTAQRFGVKDPWNPLQNLRGACRYLVQLNTRFLGRVDLILAAYNCGEALIEKRGGVPDFRETRDYIRRVIGLFLSKAPAQANGTFSRGSPGLAENAHS